MDVSMLTLEELLILHEGLRFKPYRDTEGVLTIGVGRNLDNVGISRGEAMMLLKNDVSKAVGDALTFPWFLKLSKNRQNVIVSMIFNMGLGGLLKFQGMLTALSNGDYETAANEMLDSLWAKQVKGRAGELASLMRLG